MAYPDFLRNRPIPYKRFFGHLDLAPLLREAWTNRDPATPHYHQQDGEVNVAVAKWAALPFVSPKVVKFLPAGSGGPLEQMCSTKK